MAEKICPIMAQGYLAGKNGRLPGLLSGEDLPKCVRGNCQFWVDRNEWLTTAQVRNNDPAKIGCGLALG